MSMARIFILILSYFIVSNIQISAAESRIYNGTDAVSGQFKSIASVRVNGAHECVGVIVSEYNILTVASSVSQLGATPIPASQITVRVGSINQFAGGQIHNVESVSIHPSYGNFLHNVAILRLASPLNFDEKIGQIDLPGEDDVIEDGEVVIVPGWGLQINQASPYKLQYTSLSVISESECELRAGYGYNSILCLAHELQNGICRGDEGAPVISQSGKLVGVSSFAFGSCGTKYPDVSSRVSYYLSWILANIESS